MNLVFLYFKNEYLFNGQGWIEEVIINNDNKEYSFQ